MKKITEQSRDQARWNQFGIQRSAEISENPDEYIIRDCPIKNKAIHDELIELLNPIQDKKIIELGCGRGKFSVWLAKQGAKVTSIDIGPNLIVAAKDLARVNQVHCEFSQGNITNLLYAPETFDIVIGLAILHHLSKADVLQALRASQQVLKTGGIAIFHEPVENSKLFNFVQNLIPAGKKEKSNYRPSILQRKAWASYIETLDDRAMTNEELISAGQGLFRVTRISSYGFLIRLTRFIGNNYRKKLLALDRFLFRVFPALKYYSQTVLVVYQK